MPRYNRTPANGEFGGRLSQKEETERDLMPGAGFEPAKQYAEELESTPFDHSGTPASVRS